MALGELHEYYKKGNKCAKRTDNRKRGRWTLLKEIKLKLIN